MPRIAKEPVGRRFLDDPAAVHDRDLAAVLGHDPKVVCDQENRHPRLFLQPMHQVKDLGLDGDIQPGRRLVGDQEPRPGGQHHRYQHALAHAAAELVRIGMQSQLGVWHLYLSKQLHRTFFCVRAPTLVADRACDLGAHRHQWIERAARALEDHSDPRTSHLPHPVG